MLNRLSDDEKDRIKKIDSIHINRRIYKNLDTPEIYAQAVIDFLAGMTDIYATKAFEQLLKC